jgi:hypothetical protein
MPNIDEPRPDGRIANMMREACHIPKSNDDGRFFCIRASLSQAMGAIVQKLNMVLRHAFDDYRCNSGLSFLQPCVYTFDEHYRFRVKKYPSNFTRYSAITSGTNPSKDFLAAFRRSDRSVCAVKVLEKQQQPRA